MWSAKNWSAKFRFEWSSRMLLREMCVGQCNVVRGQSCYNDIIFPSWKQTRWVTRLMGVYFVGSRWWIFFNVKVVSDLVNCAFLLLPVSQGRVGVIHTCTFSGPADSIFTSNLQCIIVVVCLRSVDRHEQKEYEQFIPEFWFFNPGSCCSSEDWQMGCWCGTSWHINKRVDWEMVWFEILI